MSKSFMKPESITIITKKKTIIGFILSHFSSCIIKHVLILPPRYSISWRKERRTPSSSQLRVHISVYKLSNALLYNLCS
jgi:hypothetical protein